MRYFLLFLAVMSTSASPLVVSVTGTFSSTTPASALSQPAGSWSLSFDIDSNPTVANVSIGNGFDASYSDFAFSVNGLPVSAPVADIRFFNNTIDGLFSVCFISDCPGNGIPANAMVFEGSQAYSGSEASPSILPGIYDASLAGVVVDNNPVLFASESPISISADTPEPSTLCLLGAGLLLTGLSRKLIQHHR